MIQALTEKTALESRKQFGHRSQADSIKLFGNGVAIRAGVYEELAVSFNILHGQMETLLGRG